MTRFVPGYVKSQHLYEIYEGYVTINETVHQKVGKNLKLNETERSQITSKPYGTVCDLTFIVHIIT